MGRRGGKGGGEVGRANYATWVSSWDANHLINIDPKREGRREGGRDPTADEK